MICLRYHICNGRKPEYKFAEIAGKKVAMKKKNLLVICAASSFCLIFVLVLVWSMGIYAEKSGTQEFEAEMEESESSDMLTKIIAEDRKKDAEEANTEDAEGTGGAEAEAAKAAKASAEAEAAKASTEAEAAKANAEAVAEAGAMAEEGLKDIWEKMYQEYEKAGKDNPDLQENIASDAKASVNGISVNDAGLILLKEINRLYPQDSLVDLKVSDMDLECSTMPNSNVVYWTGKLENGYGPTEESYRSYTCQIDSVSGKIVSFGKFQPYQKDKDYTAISWTDEEIKEHAKQLIEKYDLSQGEELDWDSVEIHNGQEEIDSLKDEFAKRPDLSISIHNTLVFEKDGLKTFYFCLDWATGEISNYLR